METGITSTKCKTKREFRKEIWRLQKLWFGKKKKTWQNCTLLRHSVFVGFEGFTDGVKAFLTLTILNYLHVNKL